ncbi:MAG: MFS transporter [Gammaproteobacteria bacterium]
MNKVITSCMIGNALEWYEFTLYGYFASIIGQLFFPSADPVVSIISAFAVFAAGFLMRPLGAVIFGHIGDKIGRKKALVISIYLMAIPTALIGLMPTYAEIGILAPIFLTLIRLLQGISVGGEFTGSMVFIIEHTEGKNRGFAGSFASLSLAVGIICGSLTAYVIHMLFTDAEIADYAWRIPFFLSVFGALIGGIMRKTLHDPQVYLDEKNANHLYKLPVKELFQKHYKSLLHAMSIELLMAVGFYLVFIFNVTYMKDFLGINETHAYYISFISTVVFAVTIPFSGYVSDTIGRTKIMLPAMIVLFVATYPMFTTITHGLYFAALTQVSGAFLLGILFGPLPALLVEMFPVKVRFTGISMAHNLSMSIFGGTMPLLAANGIRYTGDLYLPAYFVVGAAFVSMIALRFMLDRSKLSLEKLG